MALAVLYAAASHPLLSAKAADMQANANAAFIANNILAELMLGLQDAAELVDADDIDRAKYAVALQMNFQLAQGLDPFILSQKTSLLRVAKVYRDVLLNPQAVAVVEALVGADEPHADPFGGGLPSARGPVS